MVQDAGGGGGDRRERFTYMQVPDFWDMVRYHDTAPHQQALKGWRQSYELILIHRTQVEKYKEKLITAWPPKSSSAARAYIERLDQLIESLTETYNAAIANYSAYSTAIAAMDDAKRRLEAIHQEYAANAVTLAKYEEEIRNRPRAYGKAVAPPPPPSPIAAGRQEELRLEASRLISGVSAELATAQFSLTTPKPYEPRILISDTSEQVGPGGASPLPLGSSAFSQRAKISARISRPPSLSPETRGITADSGKGKIENPPAKRPSEGPILGGANPQKPPSTPPTPNPFSPLPHTSDPSSLTPPQGPPSTTASRSTATNGAPIGNKPISTAPVGATGTRGTSSALHGGVIGGNPPVGQVPSGRPTQSGQSSRTGQKVNPIGGMIGQDALARPGQRSASRAEEKGRSQRWDPDNPWETESGMDPVLLPPSEQRIHPGPTIGGR